MTTDAVSNMEGRKMKWENWVLDATMGYPFCFCPVEGDIKADYTIVTGLNMIGNTPPHNGRVVAVVHEGGQQAVDDFYAAHKTEIDEMLKKCGPDSAPPSPEIIVP